MTGAGRWLGRWAGTRVIAILAIVPGCVAPSAPPPPIAAAPVQVTPAPAPLTPFAWTGSLSQGGLILGIAPRDTVRVTLDDAAVALSPDGRFLVGFDRDAGPSATLVAVLRDGRTVTQSLAIAPRAWSISRLSTLPKYPVPAPEFARIRPGELARIAAARQMTTDADGWRQPFVWPVTGRISTLFGSQRIYKNGEAGAYHSGVDVARPTGTVVTAPAAGVVILAAGQPLTLEGNLLMLDHGMGLNSAFLHLSRIDVKPGDHVRQGQPIGAVGMTGRATGPHLHWSLKWHDAKLDPMLVAGAMQ